MQTYEKGQEPISDVPDLRYHLQLAIELEHSTIPPYLCALYSLKDGDNDEARRIIRSVVMEEMLHLSLAANILNAIGGHPSLNHRRFVPEYPTYLPHSDDSICIPLEKFSRHSIETFLKIERPARQVAPPEAHNFHTIGQFYEALGEALCRLAKKEKAEGRNLFSGNPEKQVTENFYYGGGGKLFPVSCLESALWALQEIVNQGEGIHHSIFDGDHHIFGQDKEVAHYFRFNEIHEERYYTPKDTPKSGPTGAILHVNWDEVYNMGINPKTENYPEGSELRERSEEFNRTYRQLLDTLHDAFNGKPDLLIQAVGIMYDLKYKAIALMRTPVQGKHYNAGPSFEYVGPRPKS
jgi:hypothetical protein